jgi:hypothetical protein
VPLLVGDAVVKALKDSSCARTANFVLHNILESDGTKTNRARQNHAIYAYSSI